MPAKNSGQPSLIKHTVEKVSGKRGTEKQPTLIKHGKTSTTSPSPRNTDKKK